MDNQDGRGTGQNKKKERTNRFRTISEDVRRYIEKQTQLMLLEVSDRFSLLMARSIHKLIGILFLMFAYLFLMIALARYLGPLLGHDSYGYLVVAGLTGILGFTLAAVRPRGLSRRMQRSWMNEVFDAITQSRSPDVKRDSATDESADDSFPKNAETIREK